MSGNENIFLEETQGRVKKSEKKDPVFSEAPINSKKI